MPRPSFQFYPADWRSNVKLWRCSEAARGAWISILGVLHDSDEYGVVRWSLAELIGVANVSEESTRQLVQRGVLKGSDTAGVSYSHTPRHAGKNLPPVDLVKAERGSPCWFSSRMVTDEWRRQRSGGDTKFTAENQPSRKPSRKPGRSPSRRQGSGASTSSSSSGSVLDKSNTGADGAAHPSAGPKLVHSKDDPWKAVYERGRLVLGPSSGGLITNLRKVLGDKPAKVMAKIEDAAEQRDPGPWIIAFLLKSGTTGIQVTGMLGTM